MTQRRQFQRYLGHSAVSALALFGALFVAANAGAAPQTLSIEDVGRLVVTTGPELAATRERAQAAVEQSYSARGRLLPSVHVGDEYQHWDSPFKIAFGGATFQARDQNTNTFVAGAVQPILGLFQLAHEYQARTIGADAAQAGVRASESTAREAIQLEFLRYFEAKTRGDVARASAEELMQQVHQTEAGLKAGTLTNADLLRVKVAESTARQQAIVADADATVSRSTLLVAIGRPPDDANTDFEPPNALLALGDVAAPSPESVEAHRAEIQEAKLRAQSADHEASARMFALLPDVNLEAGYQHVSGQVFAPVDSAFVGVKADWAIWEWGSQYSEKRAAEAEARAAALEIEATRRHVKAEVTGRKAELTAAGSAVALAQETVVSAQEAYRVTTELVRAGSGTTTDLLEAESALTQARLSLERARYAQAASRIRLERAAGMR